MSVTIAGAEPAAADAAAPAAAEPPPRPPPSPTAPPRRPRDAHAAAAGIVEPLRRGVAGLREVHFSTVNGALSILLVAIVVVLVGSWM